MECVRVVVAGGVAVSPWSLDAAAGVLHGLALSVQVASTHCPSHADFCSEVSAAESVADSVDHLGVQAHVALRKAFACLRLRPCLVLSKLDHLMFSSQTSPPRSQGVVHTPPANCVYPSLRSG